MCSYESLTHSPPQWCQASQLKIAFRAQKGTLICLPNFVVVEMKLVAKGCWCIGNLVTVTDRKSPSWVFPESGQTS
ncbi:MAG: hypothetical protein N2116_06885 [Armatimonadetes bacterium]|nr:hypothetical protein [Armatimonadota bacterium]